MCVSQSTNKELEETMPTSGAEEQRDKGDENHAKKQYKQLWEVTFLKQTTVVPVLYKPNKTQ